MGYQENLVKKVLDQYLGRFRYMDNFRPQWLAGLELDRFYPDLGVGVEFQGGQHFRPMPGMHTSEEDFRRQVTNDSQKRAIMFKHGYQLFALEMIDLDEYKIKGLILRMVAEGKKYAALKGNKLVLEQLNAVRGDLPLSESLIRDINRASYQKKKDYWGKQKGYQSSWWFKVLKAMFGPKKKQRY